MYGERPKKGRHGVDIDVEALKRAREDKGWSQKDLAEKVGCNSRNIERAVSRGRTSIKLLRDIAEALEVNPQRLRQRAPGGLPAEEITGDLNHRFVLEFANLRTQWVSLYGSSDDLIAPQDLSTELIPEYVVLPSDLHELREQSRRELDLLSRKKQSSVWNGKRFALISFERTSYGDEERIGLRCKFKLTDYAAFRSITMKPDVEGLVRDDAGRPTTIREKYFPAFDPVRPNPHLTHSFGISLAVISKDEKIVFVKRSGHLANKTGMYSIAMNEGMQYPRDMEAGQPSFVKAAMKGLFEELGFEPESALPLVFFNFGALARDNEYGLLGQVKLPVAFSTLVKLFALRAKDGGFETTRSLHAVDFDIEPVLRFIESHHPWSHHGLATVYFALWRKCGWERLEGVLAPRHLPVETLVSS
jgi:transcriptional regulator with XRE-family HTH domain